MQHTGVLICQVFALVLFLIAALGWQPVLDTPTAYRPRFIALGLAFWVAAELLARN